MELDINVAWLTGKFDPEAHPLLQPVPEYLCDEGGYRLHHEALDAYMNLHADAQLDGIPLVLVSTLRTFDRQKTIWENKWFGRVLTNGVDLNTIPSRTEKAQRILRYSAMPGTSRHHWGTDFDINSLEPEYFASGLGNEVWHWMRENAPRYGFAQPYTSKANGRAGYEEEPWHWSYVPVALPLLQAFVQLVRNEDLTGFEGHETAIPLRVIETYVLGIAPECKSPEMA